MKGYRDYTRNRLSKRWSGTPSLRRYLRIPTEYSRLRPLLFLLRSIAGIGAAAVVCSAACSRLCGQENRVVINEVYYDHPGPDRGMEFVELYNLSRDSVNLSGSRIHFIDGRTSGSKVYFEFRSDVYLESKGILLVGGAGLVPLPAYIGECVLQNGPDAVEFISEDLGMDLAGYGELSDSDLYESEPAEDVEAGYSLARKPDGVDRDDNAWDFVAALPTPGRRNFFSRDLGLSISEEELFPCEGSEARIEILIVNHGLEPFSGKVCLDLSSGYGMGKNYYRKVLEDCVLGEEEQIAVMATINTAGFSDSVKIKGWLAAGSDEFSGNDSDSADFYLSPYDLVINEIMYRPLKDCSEWVELYNSGSGVINLKGWTIADEAGGGGVIAEEDMFLYSGDYRILARYPGALMEEYGDYLDEWRITGVQGGWPVLNDGVSSEDPEIITLRESSGRITERVEYHDMLEDERGRSLERYSPLACSSIEGGLWHRCSDRAGETCGRVNSVYQEEASSRTGIRIYPNPFSVKEDERVVISGRLRESENGFLVRVYDIEGVEVARVFGEMGGARNYSCSWNGVDSSGRAVETGLYIFAVQYFGKGGSVCRVEKKCLAVSNIF